MLGSLMNLSESQSDTYLEFARLASGRRSCRAFRRDPVSKEVIQKLLTAAQSAPSWNNVQPWQVIITMGQGTDRFREMISARARQSTPGMSDFQFPREYRNVYQERRRACGFQLYDAVGVARGDKAGYTRQTLRNFDLFDAPHVAIITSDEALGVYGAVDCGLYISHFMLAAQSLGIGSIAQGALASYSDSISEFFDLDDTRRVVCGISFGWCDDAAKVNQYRTERAGLEDVVRWVET